MIVCSESPHGGKRRVRRARRFPRQNWQRRRGLREIRLAEGPRLAGRNRQRRDSLTTSFSGTGLLRLHYLGYAVAGKTVWARRNFGGLGATITKLAYPLELPAIRNMETASRPERAQSTARAHLARERGDPQSIKDELVQVNRGRLKQCLSDLLAEFTGRAKLKPAGILPRPGSSRGCPRARSRSRQRYGSSQGPHGRRTTGHAQSPQAGDRYEKRYSPPPKRPAKEEESGNGRESR